MHENRINREFERRKLTARFSEVASGCLCESLNADGVAVASATRPTQAEAKLAAIEAAGATVNFNDPPLAYKYL